jgi:diguanylate cyclase (GGDEF)-like protein
VLPLLRTPVKEFDGRADNSRVKFDLTRPTGHQLREGLISGLIAWSITVPILVTVIIVDHHPLKWWYIGAAIACIIVSPIYAAFFVAITKARTDVGTQARLVFVVVCLALLAMGLIEVGSSSKLGIYTPGVLVGVIFICIIGDRRMRIAIDVYAIVLVGVVNVLGGLRGSNLVATELVYTSTIVVITWITARTVGSLNEHVNFRRAVGSLNEAFDEEGPSDTPMNADNIRHALQRGVPFIDDIVPVDRVAVFARTARGDQITALAIWPQPETDISDLAGLPDVDEALRTQVTVHGGPNVSIPIGACGLGELVMVAELQDTTNRERIDERVELIATTFRRMTNRANLVSGLQAESRIDPLTGLANRRSLFERIEIEMEHALRAEAPLSLAMIDLDFFKKYNDRYGHVAGDMLLRSIAALMVSNIRGQDLAARYGGEEFCLVLPDTDIVGGHHLLDKLRSGGRNATSDFGITLSAGLTSWDGIEDTASLIERADQALYRAKESGRDRVVSIQSFTEF